LHGNLEDYGLFAYYITYVAIMATKIIKVTRMKLAEYGEYARAYLKIMKQIKIEQRNNFAF